MNRDMYYGLLNTRRAIARVLILCYPEAELLSDLPQELVQAFDIITDILVEAIGVDEGRQVEGRSHFRAWWNLRNSFIPNWLEGDWLLDI